MLNESMRLLTSGNDANWQRQLCDKREIDDEVLEEPGHQSQLAAMIAR